jgi:uncharacterized membrane protein YphA (DoxX/SURF4 family)
MNRTAVITAITWLCRLVVGGAFIYAGVVKIIDPAAFAKDIGNYQLMPDITIHLLAITLPWIEVVAGLLVLLGWWMRASLIVIGAMLVVFVAAISAALARGLDISCGCFGSSKGRRVGLITLVQDIVFLVMIAWLWWQSKKEKDV